MQCFSLAPQRRTCKHLALDKGSLATYLPHSSIYCRAVHLEKNDNFIRYRIPKLSLCFAEQSCCFLHFSWGLKHSLKMKVQPHIVPNQKCGTLLRSVILRLIRISNISHFQVISRNVNKKLWTFFGPWGRYISLSVTAMLKNVDLPGLTL